MPKLQKNNCDLTSDGRVGPRCRRSSGGSWLLPARGSSLLRFGQFEQIIHYDVFQRFRKRGIQGSGHRQPTIARRYFRRRRSRLQHTCKLLLVCHSLTMYVLILSYKYLHAEVELLLLWFVQNSVPKYSFWSQNTAFYSWTATVIWLYRCKQPYSTDGYIHGHSWISARSSLVNIWAGSAAWFRPFPLILSSHNLLIHSFSFG